MRSVFLLWALAFATGIRSQQMATLPHDGSVRIFHYYVPSNLQANELLPLLIALHGLPKPGAGLMDITSLMQSPNRSALSYAIPLVCKTHRMPT
jgi:poly(3-hydroxybutyrate) depolymerase